LNKETILDNKMCEVIQNTAELWRLLLMLSEEDTANPQFRNSVAEEKFRKVQIDS